MTRGVSARFRVTQGDTVTIDETRSPYDDYVESFYRFERECTDAMLDGRPVRQTAARNFQTLAATFAAYAAAQEGRTLEVPPFLATGAVA
jgi:hypothetical protein